MLLTRVYGYKMEMTKMKKSQNLEKIEAIEEKRSMNPKMKKLKKIFVVADGPTEMAIKVTKTTLKIKMGPN